MSICVYQIQKQIENLKLNQAEKELELKEATTRRKLQELKSQLLHSPSTQVTKKSSPVQSAFQYQNQSTWISDGDEKGEQYSSSGPNSEPEPTSHKPVQSVDTSIEDILTQEVHLVHRRSQSKTDKKRGSSLQVKGSGWEELVHSNRERSRAVASTSPESAYSTSSDTDQSSETRSLRDQGRKHNVMELSTSRNASVSSTLLTGTQSCSTPTEAHFFNLSRPPIGLSPKNTCSPTFTAHSSQHKSSRNKSLLYPRSTNSHSIPLKDSSQLQQSPPSSEVLKQRLSFPSKLEETDSLSGIQHQRSRVLKIRRCIAAATIIQRAWRQYRQNQ